MLSGESMATACFARSSNTTFVAASMPRLMSIGFMPAATALQPGDTPRLQKGKFLSRATARMQCGNSSVTSRGWTGGSDTNQSQRVG